MTRHISEATEIGRDGKNVGHHMMTLSSCPDFDCRGVIVNNVILTSGVPDLQVTFAGILCM